MLHNKFTKLAENLFSLKKKRDTQRFFDRYFSKIADKSGINLNNPVDSNYDAWSKKWSKTGKKPSKTIYSVYSNFLDDHAAILPNDVARYCFEPFLTPHQFQSFYNDKNSFNLFIDKSIMPKTIFRSMNRHYLDENYELISVEDVAAKLEEYDRFVIKPTTDMGGRGVTIITNKDGRFYDQEGNEFSIEYLDKHFGTNFIVQECIRQCEYMAQFNPSSINTLRVATYRDIESGKISVIGAVMRMGGAGSFVDNACSGGVFISIDGDGRLGKFVCDEYGRKSIEHNGINFQESDFTIPDYDKVKAFAIDVAKRFPHMSLFANDIAIVENGKPLLIEVNTKMFSYWLYQFTGKTILEKQTDSLINFYVNHKEQLRSEITTSFNY